jgi:hypothetical protein
MHARSNVDILMVFSLLGDLAVELRVGGLPDLSHAPSPMKAVTS